jgi:hypothetical protein
MSNKQSVKQADIYERVTRQIVEAIEGNRPVKAILDAATGLRLPSAGGFYGCVLGVG